jgi:hypothetical protein
LLSGKALTLWKTFIILVLSLILGRFIVVGQTKVLFNTISSDGDESAFLALGLDMAEEGTLSDGARSPLYPFLLTFVAEREWDYFTRAKMLTMGLGALAVVATFLVGKVLFGWEVGLLGAFLLAANKEFHLRASTVYADVLFVSIFLGTWYFLIKSFKGWRYCILAGVFVGLAYLSKGSGPLLLGAWGLVALLHYRSQIWQHRKLLLVPLFFLITTSPLLVYNARQFGDPFYNVNSAHVLWMDRLDQSHVADPADLPTMSTFFQTHTAADIVARLQYGTTRLNAYLPRVLIPSRTLEPAWLRPVLLTGAIMVIGAILVWRREWLVDYYRHYQITVNVSLLLFAIFYFFLAWYARLQVESRFIIPLLGPLYLLLAHGLVDLGRRVGQWARRRRDRTGPAGSGKLAWGAYLGGVAVLLMWGIGWLMQTSLDERWGLTVDPFASDRQANVEVDVVLDWLTHDRPLGEVQVFFGPSKSLPLWKFPRRFAFKRTPVDVDTWPAFQTYVAGLSPEYMLMDSDTARRRRQALGGHFDYEEGIGVEFEQVPADWVLAYLHDAVPHTWAIFQPFSSPSIPVTANLGDQVELLGYDLRSQGAGSDRILRVAIYWRAIADLRENYTMFVHLTAPNGFVKAQRDQPPFNGFWSTSRWTPGDILADRYDIPLDESIRPGEYLLLAGLYSPQSGQRLPLVAGPAAPSPEAVLLGTVQIE